MWWNAREERCERDEKRRQENVTGEEKRKNISSPSHFHHARKIPLKNEKSLGGTTFHLSFFKEQS